MVHFVAWLPHETELESKNEDFENQYAVMEEKLLVPVSLSLTCKLMNTVCEANQVVRASFIPFSRSELHVLVTTHATHT